MLLELVLELVPQTSPPTNGRASGPAITSSRYSTAIRVTMLYSSSDGSLVEDDIEDDRSVMVVVAGNDPVRRSSFSGHDPARPRS